MYRVTEYYKARLNKGRFPTLSALNTKYPTGKNGRFATVGNNPPAQYLWNSTSLAWEAETTGISDAPIDGNQYGRENGAWTVISAGVIPSNTVFINTVDPEVTGKQYQSFAHAEAYIATQTPSSSNPWVRLFSGLITEDVEKKDYSDIRGMGMYTSILNGTTTLDSGVAQGANSFYSMALKSLTMEDKTSGTIPVVATVAQKSGYTPATTTYSFGLLPLSGTYSITFGSKTTAAIPYNATASEVEIAIRAMASVFSQVTVIGDYTTSFTITRTGLTATPIAELTVITVNNIDLSPYGGSYAEFNGVFGGIANPVLIRANNIGSIGNQINLITTGLITVNNMIMNWNMGHPTNVCTLISGDGTQIPNTSNAQLSGGTDGISVINKDGLAEIQQFVFDSTPTAGERKFMVTYNAVDYISSTLYYNSTNTDIQNELVNIFNQIVSDGGQNLGTTSVADARPTFSIALKGFPGAMPAGFFSIPASIPGAYATYTGQELGMTTPVTVTADVIGSAGNNIILSFNGADTINTQLSAWNANNPSNTATLVSGDGTQIPNNKTAIKVLGGADARAYSLVSGGSIDGQFVYLEDVLLSDFKYTGTKGVVVHNRGIIFGGNFTGASVKAYYDIIQNGTFSDLEAEFSHIVPTTKVTLGTSSNIKNSYVDAKNITFDPGAHVMSGGILGGNIKLDNGITLQLFNVECYGVTITVYAGGTLHTQNCLGLTVVLNGGVWIDDTILQNAGTPVGSVAPRFVGDRCLDTTGPTYYTAYGLANTDWIS